MGYLDKSTITVDAILTNRGRELLSQGSGANTFQITKFAVADDEVDYGLYRVDHPLGSNYYGAVIENMPVLEATPDETQTMRYKLVTITGNDLTRFGNVVIPQIRAGNAGVTLGGTVTLYYNSTVGEGSIPLKPTTTYTSTEEETENSYTLLLADSSLASIEITNPALGVVTANERGSIVANGKEFVIKAKNKTGSTSISIFGGTSGAVYSFTLSTVASS
tara:strand:- start:664 stop:1323 length:660 start_codon:yes stop_codon:yes gene_type:complete